MAESIKRAAGHEWSFEDWTQSNSGDVPSIFASGRVSLAGGESEEEFANRLAFAVFQANGQPCKVDVNALFLEDGETYSCDDELLPANPRSE